MNPFWIIRTARLELSPVQWRDLPDLKAIKADPQVFAIMLGGVRTPVQTEAELADDIVMWAARGYGAWSVRDWRTGEFQGLTGFMERPDGRGVALRFGFWPEAQGSGLGREAASAALRFGHDNAGLERIIAVVRQSNFGSRIILGGIGMVECDAFIQNGYQMVVYESIRRPALPPINPTRRSP